MKQLGRIDTLGTQMFQGLHGSFGGTVGLRVLGSALTVTHVAILQKILKGLRDKGRTSVSEKNTGEAGLKEYLLYGGQGGCRGRCLASEQEREARKDVDARQVTLRTKDEVISGNVVPGKFRRRFGEVILPWACVGLRGARDTTKNIVVNSRGPPWPVKDPADLVPHASDPWVPLVKKTESINGHGRRDTNPVIVK
jgi:hypothetical protein